MSDFSLFPVSLPFAPVPPTHPRSLLLPPQLNFPNIDALLKQVIGDSEVHELMYVPSRKRILVRLADHVGREGLERLNPSHSTMTALHDGSLCSSVTVTVRGKVLSFIIPFSFLSLKQTPISPLR